MKVFRNEELSHWQVELDQDVTLRKYMPMTSFSLVNNSAIEATVVIEGEYMGTAFPYGSFSVSGKNFERFTIFNPEGQDFYKNELIVNVGKDIVVSQDGYNPMLETFDNNLDRYASGCDNRISLNLVDGYPSKTVSPEMVKYVINRNNGLVVQRRLVITGHDTNVAKYNLIFSDIDNLIGTIPVNDVLNYDTRLRKTIKECEFEYILTDCIIDAWVVDYKKRIVVNHLLNGSSTGPNWANMVDDNIHSFQAHYTSSNSYVELSYLTVTIAECELKELHFLIAAKNSDAGASGWFVVEVCQNGVWGGIYGGVEVTSQEYEWHEHSEYNPSNRDKITGIRVRAKCDVGSVLVYVNDYSFYI